MSLAVRRRMGTSTEVGKPFRKLLEEHRKEIMVVRIRVEAVEREMLWR